MVEEGSVGAGLRVGLFGIGLDAYWPQFAGLKERLKATSGRWPTSCSGPAWRS